VEFVFFYFSIKTSLVKALGYFLNMLAMFRHVVSVGEYIIQIGHDTNIQKVREEIIHKLLEDHKNIGKTEEHYKLLK